MLATIETALTHRDRAVLRAVAAGRCRQSTTFGSLTVDGLSLADQFAGRRLVDAGLITSQDGPTVLTESGRTLLAAA
jgi:hypothetical protein